MTRLPQPGSDAGTWGEILNDFLATSLKPDGTLQDNVVTTASMAPSAVDGVAIASASISEDKLDVATQAKLNAGSVVGDATTTSKGIILLAGDLSGSATAPTVPGLAGKANASHTHVVPDITNLQTSLDAKADQTALTSGLAGKANVSHTHSISDTTSLQATLDNKAALVHTHSVSDVASLQADLDAKADQTALTSGLAGKANTSHTHTVSDIVALQTDLDAKADQVTTYTKTEVDTALSGKADVVHTHSQALSYSHIGDLVTEVGTFRLYNDSGATWVILGIRANVGSPPTGASAIFDINIGGVTIFTNQANRPTIVANAFTSGFVTSMDVTTIPSGSYLTIDIDQVGSVLPGTNLSAQVMVK